MMEESTPKLQSRIALVQASSTMTKSPPLALMCISAILEKEGYETEVFDLCARPARLSELTHRVAANQFDWVGFTAMTSGMPATKQVVAQVRDASPSIPILMGGIHASTLPERTLRELPIDAVCTQAGDDVCVGFARKVVEGKRDWWNIAGVAALDEEGTYRFSEDLAATRVGHPLPRPNWDAIDLADYQDVTIQYIRRGRRVAPIITARGCPFSCAFCAVPAFSGTRLLHRDPVEVVDEIEFLVKERGVDEIQIFDDIFNVKQKYAKAVLRELISRNLKIVWKAPVGFWLLVWDEEFLELLAKSGCYQVGFGIESGSSAILNGVNKLTANKLDKFAPILQRYRDHGISTFGFFILGLEGETAQTIRQTIDFACELPLDHVNVSIYTPYPGSPLFDQMLKAGKNVEDWGEYFHYHLSDEFSISELRNRELRRWMRIFYLRFYSDPRRALNLARDIRRSGVKPFVKIARTVFA